ncbi:hypothetical protein HYX18_04705 [Candidatus Woesearchaeota archaeon]|nr:hypothetical protein [Candidatus Woesearchaeota archaeon]
MIYELLEYRKDDNYSPYADIQIIKGTKFLLKRVNPDGSINYEDENGTYYYDYDLSSDPRGWLGILPGMAYEQKVFGRDDVSKKILEFLFSHQLNGSDVGGYPGKWGYFDPNETWETGTPLIKGTSMIFWYLTAIPLINTSCQNGIKIQCEVTPDNCSPAFIDLNACNAGFRGDDTCINGVFTHCLNYTILKYNYYHNCAELSRECHPLDPYCEKVCYLIGSGRCIENTNYCGECFDTRKRCTTECQPDPIPECEVEP